MKKQIILKFLLLFLLFLILASTIIFFVYSRISDNKKEISFVKKKAKISVQGIKQTFTKDGKKQADISAVSANYFNEENKIEFIDVNAILFLQNKKIFLKCDKAYLYTDNNNLEVFGKVKLNFKEKKFNSDNLFYNSKNATIHTKSSPVFFGENFVVSGKSMLFFLNENILKMEGKIEAKLYN